MGSLNMSQFSKDLGILMSIPDGTPLKCVYYLNQHDTSVSQTYSLDEGIDTSYLKIIDYEVIADSEFKFAYDSQKNESTIEGEIRTYPGSKVYIGDIFLLDNGDGKTAIYAITSKERMSPRNDTFYSCRVTFIGYLTDDILAKLDSRVYETAYFDKKNYLAGTRALIKHQSFVDKIELQKMRGILLKQYHSMFFNTEANSYFRNDGAYDPHIVDYMFGRIDVEDKLTYPSQLLIDSAYESRLTSLWQVISTDWMSAEFIDASCTIRCNKQDTYSAHITSLANRDYVALDENADDVYMFEHILGHENVDIMVKIDGESVSLKDILYRFIKNDVTPEEVDVVVEVTGYRFFKEYGNIIENKMVDDVECILETAKTKMSPEERFYLTPLLLHAINQALVQM